MLSPEVVERCHIVSTETKVCMGRVGQGTFDAPSLIFPYFNQEGKLVSVQSRYLGEEKEKSRFKFAPGSHRMVYGLERLKEYPKQEPLLITEGPSDCWTALTLGFHAIAIPSATLLTVIASRFWRDEIFICFLIRMRLDSTFILS